MAIYRFQKSDQEELRSFVLKIQNEEFNLGFTENEQVDLIYTESFYKDGGFWIAKVGKQIVGTIGLQKLSDEKGALRKMFVKLECRGKEPKIGQVLFNELIRNAKTLNFKEIFLDTPSVAIASHKFYERNGFLQIGKDEIPDSYKYPDRNSKVYKLKLK